MTGPNPKLPSICKDVADKIDRCKNPVVIKFVNNYI